jgi:hypothetical protein
MHKLKNEALFEAGLASFPSFLQLQRKKIDISE